MEVHVEEYCQFIETGRTIPARDLFMPEEFLRSRFLLELCALIGTAFAANENTKNESITIKDVYVAMLRVKVALLRGEAGILMDKFIRLRDLLIQDQAEHYAMLYDAALAFVGNALSGRFLRQHLEKNARKKRRGSLEQMRERLSMPDNATKLYELLKLMLSGVRVS